MIKSHKLLWLGSILTVAFLLATFFVPTTMATDEVTSVDETTIEAEAEALGIRVPGTFYFLKQFGQNLQKAFTFNSVKKAEIDLQQASEQLIRAKSLSQSSEDPTVQAKIDKAITKYEEKIAAIQAKSDKFRADAPELADKFMDKLTDRQIKQQDIMSKLEDSVSESAWANLSQVRERTMEYYGEVVGNLIEDKKKIAEHMQKAFENQNESDFNRLKHIEILKSLEDKVPEEARAAIIAAQDNILNKFKEESDELPEEIRNMNFQTYLEKARLHDDEQLEVLDEIYEDKMIPTSLKDSYELIKKEREMKREALKDGIENMNEEAKQAMEQVREQTKQELKLQRNGFENKLDENRQQLQETHQEQLREAEERFKNLLEVNKENEDDDEKNEEDSPEITDTKPESNRN